MRPARRPGRPIGSWTRASDRGNYISLMWAEETMELVLYSNNNFVFLTFCEPEQPTKPLGISCIAYLYIRERKVKVKKISSNGRTDSFGNRATSCMAPLGKSSETCCIVHHHLHFQGLSNAVTTSSPYPTALMQPSFCAANATTLQTCNGFLDAY